MITLRIGYIWFKFPQIGLFMQAIDEEVDILLGILLLIASKLLIELAKDMLEALWHDDLV